MNSLDDLKLSLTTLNDRFGSATPGLATTINLAFILLGGLAYWQLDGIPAYIGLFFAVISAVAIAKWVMRA